MILKVFIDFFLGQNRRWMVKKNICNLIIAIGFNFCANLTIRSSLNCWDQSITVGSSKDFKYDNSEIYPRYIPIYPRYIPIYLRYFIEKLK